MRAKFYVRALRMFGLFTIGARAAAIGRRLQRRRSSPVIAAVTINKPLDEVGQYVELWRSVAGAKSAADRVVLARAPGRDITEMRVEVAPGDGALRRRLAAPRVRSDLQRFKEIVETGEVLR